jgi:hypothetical protein
LLKTDEDISIVMEKQVLVILQKEGVERQIMVLGNF